MAYRFAPGHKQKDLEGASCLELKLGSQTSMTLLMTRSSTTV